MMSLIALPLVVGATREALKAIPGHVREASYALGKTKAATIRRVLLPAARPGIGTGAALGMGRVAGDTAIVVVLLGATLQIQRRLRRGFGLFRGTGSTLTSYVYLQLARRRGARARKSLSRPSSCCCVVIGLNFVVTSIAAPKDRRSGPADPRQQPDRRRRHPRTARARRRRCGDPGRLRDERRSNCRRRTAPAPRPACAGRPAPGCGAPSRRRRRRSSGCGPKRCSIAYGEKRP